MKASWSIQFEIQADFNPKFSDVAPTNTKIPRITGVSSILKENLLAQLNLNNQKITVSTANNSKYLIVGEVVNEEKLQTGSAKLSVWTGKFKEVRGMKVPDYSRTRISRNKTGYVTSQFKYKLLTAVKEKVVVQATIVNQKVSDVRYGIQNDIAQQGTVTLGLAFGMLHKFYIKYGNDTSGIPVWSPNLGEFNSAKYGPMYLPDSNPETEALVTYRFGK